MCPTKCSKKKGLCAALWAANAPGYPKGCPKNGSKDATKMPQDSSKTLADAPTCPKALQDAPIMPIHGNRDMFAGPTRDSFVTGHS